MKPQKPYLDRFKVPHFGRLNNEESADGERNESVLQSLVLPDLRHIGIKTSLSHSEDNEEHYTYDSKKGLRYAISQAYRRLPPLRDDDIRNNKDVEMSQQKPEDTETISRHGDTLAIFQTMLDNLYSPRECEEE